MVININWKVLNFVWQTRENEDKTYTEELRFAGLKRKPTGVYEDSVVNLRATGVNQLFMV